MLSFPYILTYPKGNNVVSRFHDEIIFRKRIERIKDIHAHNIFTNYSRAISQEVVITKYNSQYVCSYMKTAETTKQKNEKYC